MMSNSIDKLDLDKLSLRDIDEYVASHEKELQSKSKSKELQFDIIKNLGRLSDKKNSPFLTLVDWGGYIRYDIRGWNEDMSVPRKGISFSKEELTMLLNGFDLFDFSHIGEKMAYEYKSGRVKAKIYENICILSETKGTEEIWKKEINIADWGYGLKVDMRKWNDDHSKCSKGICITIEEYQEAINKLSFEK